ncbi:MAG TPA: hypothetical protein VGI74_25640 [Streptosporangiaceae bacterium]
MTDPFLPPIAAPLAEPEAEPGPGAGARAAIPSLRSGNRHPLLLSLAIIAALLGVAGLVASLTGVAVQALPRRFSATQQRQIMAWQVASRWRSWPAGEIFPAAVSYQLPYLDFGAASGLTLTAHRVGIAPQSSCAQAADQALATVLAAHGCLAVLRATYTDSTGSLVVTVGVVITRATAPRPGSLPGGQGLRPAVKAVAFPGTLASRFGDQQRQTSGGFSRGSYLFLYTAGYTDGRTWDHVSLDPYAASEMNSLGTGVAQSIGARLGAAPPVPHCPGSPEC